jgi:hypothetical protein
MTYPKMLCARGKKLDTSLLVAHIAVIIHLINVRINLFSNPIGIFISYMYIYRNFVFLKEFFHHFQIFV